jgi:hypothetical protein
MRLGAAVDRSTLIGAVVVMPVDALLGRPAGIPCAVTAYRDADLVPVQRAAVHPAGVYGFLTLRPGRYRILVEPEGRFLPTLGTIDVPAPPAPTVKVTARLRPAPSCAPPPGAIVLRGTLWWQTDPPVPARRAAVFGSLAATAIPGIEQASAWTRSDDNGDFGLILLPLAPGSDGAPLPLTATVAIRTAAPGPSAAAPGALDELPLDDGEAAGVKSREALRRTVVVATAAGDELSLNSDRYVSPERLVPNTVIWLTPT